MKHLSDPKLINFQIENHTIGQNHPTFIIAELSANHLQKYDLALETVHAAHKAGADAIKLQTYTPDTITIDCSEPPFQIKSGTIWDGKTLYQLYGEAFTPWEWQPKLNKAANDLGLTCFSSPFDNTAVDFMEEMKMPAYKIASFEITDTALIKYIAQKKKPVIISTGIASLSDIETAIEICRLAGNNQVAVLKCTSAYPAPYDEINLRTIESLQKMFKVPIGLSDHTLGIEVPIAAVAVGARIIEKHFILDRKLGGPDAEFSLQPDEFSNMVRSIRNVEKSMGDYEYKVTNQMLKGRYFSRSLFVVKDIRSGQEFTSENIRSIRPGQGIEPKHLGSIIGKKAKNDIKRGTPLSWNHIL